MFEFAAFSTKNYLMKQNKLFQGINMHNFFSNNVDRQNNRITRKSTCNFKCSVFQAKSGTQMITQYSARVATEIKTEKQTVWKKIYTVLKF